MTTQRIKGTWNLVRMNSKNDKKNWLLIKSKDKYANKDINVVNKYTESVISGS